MLKKSLLAGAVMLFGAGAANAADVIDVVPVSDWTGFYAGVHAGYGWGDIDYSAELQDAVECVGDCNLDIGRDVDADGFFAGLQAGFNWQVDSFLIGIEGDISKSWISGDDEERILDDDVDFDLGEDIDVNADVDLNWFGTLRARAGVLVTPAMLIYATGGLAWGNVDTDFSIDTVDGGDIDFSDGDSTNHMGWTLGAGLEYAVSEAVSLKLEYLYVDLGEEELLDEDFNEGELNINVEEDINFHTVRAGLNFHF